MSVQASQSRPPPGACSLRWWVEVMGRRQAGGAMSVARLAARTVIGGLFIGHGTQKLFGWFGGPGPEGTEAMMESLQLRPGKTHALLAGTTETVAGSLLAVGLATPAAAAGLTGVM